MRRTSTIRAALSLAAVLLCCAFPAAAAAQEDKLRAEIVKLGQVTGDTPFAAQARELLNDLDRAKKLIPVALKMAGEKETELTYHAALTLALAAERMKDYAACETFFRFTADRAVKTYSTKKLAQAYGGLVEVLYNNKKYADAVKVCREVLELKTGDEKPRKFLFLVEDKFGDFGFEEDDTFDVARAARGPFYKFMIRALAKDGKYDQALKMTDNLIRANDNWEDRELKGWVLREAARYAEAAKVYEDVLERIAKDKELEQAEKDEAIEQTRYLLSGVYVDAKQVDKAADHLKWLVDRNPTDPGYYNDLGFIWADHDMNLKEAEKLIRKALDLDRERRKKTPTFNPAKDRDKGSYLDSLGWVLFKQKQYEEAKKVLVEALKDQDAQHIEIYDHLGDTYLALGQRDQALEAWRQGLKVAGDDRRERERKTVVEMKIEKNK